MEAKKQLWSWLVHWVALGELPRILWKWGWVVVVWKSQIYIPLTQEPHCRTLTVQVELLVYCSRVILGKWALVF